MASLEFIKDPSRGKREIDYGRVRCGALTSGSLLCLATAASIFPTVLDVWRNSESLKILNLPGAKHHPPPLVTADLWSYTFTWEASIPHEERRSGLTWDELCKPDPEPPTGNDGHASPLQGGRSACANISNITGNTTSSDCANVSITPAEDDFRSAATVSTTMLDLETFPPYKGHPYTCVMILGTRTLVFVICVFEFLATVILIRVRLWPSLLLLLAASATSCLCSVLAMLAVTMMAIIDLDGLLRAQAVYYSFGGALLALAGGLMGIYQASKGTPQQPRREDNEPKLSPSKEELIKKIWESIINDEAPTDEHGEEIQLPRLDRIRVMKQAVEASEEKEISFADWQRLERFAMGSKAGARTGLAQSMFGYTKEEIIIMNKKHPALERALEFISLQASRGTSANKIPAELLEQAFNSIDFRMRGEVTISEFRCALQTCGINTDERAMGMVLEEIDANGNGLIEIQEFKSIFILVEDMLLMDAKVKSQAKITEVACQILFAANVFGVSALTFSNVRDPDASLTQLLLCFCVTLVLLCMAVIVWPFCRHALGSKWKVWRVEIGRERRRRARMTRDYCISCCRRMCRCCKRSQPEEPDSSEVSSVPAQDKMDAAEDLEKGFASKDTIFNAWGSDSGDVSAFMKRSRSRTRQLTFHHEDDVVPIDSDDEGAANASSDLRVEDADASDYSPSTPGSSRRGSKPSKGSKNSSIGRGNAKNTRRRWSLLGSANTMRRSSLLGSALIKVRGRSRSKKTGKSGSGLSHSGTGLSSSWTRSKLSLSRSTTVKSLKSKASRSDLDASTPLWKKLLPRVLRRRLARVRQKKQVVEEDETYAPQQYEAAALRALAATTSQHTSFSPMQCRNLQRAPPPEEPQVFIL